MIVLYIATTAFAIVMGFIILLVRMRAAKKPTNARKIILPPFFMATGFLMFAVPIFHVDVRFAIIAFLFGNLLAIPLIKTSSFMHKESNIYLERSKLFIVIIISLVILRLMLRSYINQYVSIYETSSLFFILAFGMLLPWRLSMYRTYKQLENSLRQKEKERMA
jgi:membrane protein CcdC involved in cytochrome C biogenesis